MYGYCSASDKPSTLLKEAFIWWQCINQAVVERSQTGAF